MSTTGRPVLEVEGLCSTFATPRGPVQAVREVSLTVGRGEIVGLVGESGSGKTATAQSVMRLLPDTATVTGAISLSGRDLLALSEAELRSVRGNDVTMVFQDPMTSLNPVLTVGTHLRDVLRAHRGRCSRAEADRRGEELLRMVGIPEPAQRLRQYAHQLSGGMRQRVMIALALANEPDLLIADEPTTALDATVQAEILDLLVDLRDRLGMSILLVTHDLGVVSRICDRLLVMYGGRLVEQGPAAEVLADPLHPYTEALIGSAVSPEQPRDLPLQTIPGSPPSLLHPPPGCPFAPRCPVAEPACTESPVPTREHGPGRSAACVVAARREDAR